MFWYKIKRRKIKSLFWALIPIIIGIYTASFLFTIFKINETKTILQEANVAAIIEEKIIEKPKSINLIFVGDIMLDRGVKHSVIKNLDGDYNKLFYNLDILKNFDIVFANLEGSVSDKGKDRHNLYSFRMDPKIIPALVDAGISIVSVANNHIGDWGRDAYIDSLRRLKEGGVLYAGGGMNIAEAETPTIIEKNGMKMGFLAFSDVGPNDLRATSDKAGLLIAGDKNFDTIIQNASKQVDYLVVSFHFGDEYKTTHNERQKLLAHKAVDNGAKIIIGAHPHVPQDTEVYKRIDCTQSSCMGFIIYSLGNFIFDQSWSASTMEGMLLEIKLNKDGSMFIKKDIVKLNKFFQPEVITEGLEEQIKF